MNEFWVGFNTASSKAEYLTQFSEGKKTSFSDQVEAVFVDELNSSGLGYQQGSGCEEEKAMKANTMVV